MSSEAKIYLQQSTSSLCLQLLRFKIYLQKYIHNIFALSTTLKVMSENDRNDSKKVDIRRGKRVRRNSPARPRSSGEAHSSYSFTYDIEQSYAILDQLEMSSRKIYSRQLLIVQGSSSSNPRSYQTQFTSANIHTEGFFSFTPTRTDIGRECSQSSLQQNTYKAHISLIGRAT
ncbi:uncharacterized protein LOC144572093 isoform X2 [Carex rostrata]